MTTKDDDNARCQARAQFNSIREMVEEFKAAMEDDGPERAARDRIEDARQRIEEDALSVEVRGGWHQSGEIDKDQLKPVEYRILLCTGGPAVQIVGDLDEWCQPETAHIQYQDWFTPWTDWRGEDVPDDAEDILLEYARVFWFGE